MVGVQTDLINLVLDNQYILTWLAKTGGESIFECTKKNCQTIFRNSSKIDGLSNARNLGDYQETEDE